MVIVFFVHYVRTNHTICYNVMFIIPIIQNRLLEINTSSTLPLPQWAPGGLVGHAVLEAPVEREIK